MKKATICFCIKDEKILLGMKKYDFGKGKWNGYGGKLKEGETPKTAAARELLEESGLTVEEKDLEPVALIHFEFDKEPVFDCYVFITHVWKGEPVETEEMRPQWFPLSALPYDDMWAADRKWIPLILEGNNIEAIVDFNTDGTVVNTFSYNSVELPNSMKTETSAKTDETPENAETTENE